MNPHIVQPVPRRLSPESPVIPTSDDDGTSGPPVSVKQGRREVHYEQLWNVDDAASTAEESLSSLTLRGDSVGATAGSSRRTLRSDNNTTDEEELDDDCSTEIDGLQDLSTSSPPPLPKDGPISLPHFSNALNKQRSPPPPPPPRPSKTHARSSSLDLNHRYAGGQVPPAVPPRNNNQRITEEEEPSKVKSSSTRDAKQLQMSIHQYKERNSVIARTINELHQEVSDTLEERIALEFHLEQLKSFGD